MFNRQQILWTSSIVDDAHVRHSAGTLGRSLALRLLEALGGENSVITTDERGKPVVCGPAVRHISISHSRSTVAAAASTVGPIGIDVEYRDPNRDLDRLASAAFGPTEYEAVVAHGVSAFYRIWTLREAISKATGDGMALVMDRNDHVPTLMADGLLVRANTQWLLAHQQVACNFSLALAVQVASAEGGAPVQGCSLDRLHVHTAYLEHKVSSR